ncbi:4-hydroxythreonine-4-phosphate dehydrogenase, partial [hydrothermal vent metagenome]
KAALQGGIDGITTAPLNKSALHQAGLNFPGHTEILAKECHCDQFAMMLYLPPDETIQSPHGLGVAHVTLHTSIQSVPQLLSTEDVFQTGELLARFMQQVGCKQPRIAICALNPHAGEAGLFGDEEEKLITPAVKKLSAKGVDVTGPLPADTLILRAVRGQFDGIVAMYHDQGHIPFKLLGFHKAVNITLGLPIVRTSPSHGTAFDIANKYQADATGMIEAIRMAVLLVK